MNDRNSPSLRGSSLSLNFATIENEAFAFAANILLHGGDGYFRIGDVMKHMTQLIRCGTSFPTHQQTEIGRWDQRYLVDLDPLPDIPNDHYYAWVAPGYHDYEPPLVTYTKTDFMILFEDCCRNFVAHHPDSIEEFSLAMKANGMSLSPSIERP